MLIHLLSFKSFLILRWHSLYHPYRKSQIVRNLSSRKVNVQRTLAALMRHCLWDELGRSVYIKTQHESWRVAFRPTKCSWKGLFQERWKRRTCTGAVKSFVCLSIYICICVHVNKTYHVHASLHFVYLPLQRICTTGHLASCCVFLAFCDSTSSRRTRHGISGFASAEHGVSPCIEWRGCNALPRTYGKLTRDLCARHQKPWYSCN